MTVFVNNMTERKDRSGWSRLSHSRNTQTESKVIHTKLSKMIQPNAIALARSNVIELFITAMKGVANGKKIENRRKGIVNEGEERVYQRTTFKRP